MYSDRAIRIVRLIFALLSACFGVLLAIGFGKDPIAGGFLGLLFALVMIGIEALFHNFSFRNFAAGTFGLLVGLLCAWLITRISALGTADFFVRPEWEQFSVLLELAIFLALGFLGTALALRSNREEFSMIIPYVRFRRDSTEDQTTLLDTNILIDGRIHQLCQTGFLSGPFIVPHFVLDELHLLADSPSLVRKERGKRGLETIEQLRRIENIEVNVHNGKKTDSDQPVDSQLIQLARNIGARLLTNDANLGQVARLQGVPTLNLHELTDALRPQLLVGDQLELELVKRGKDHHQAVGFLADGAMVVVNNAIDHIGDKVPVTISSTLQTNTGRLIFAEMANSTSNTQNTQSTTP